jgi:hypothetical protein
MALSASQEDTVENECFGMRIKYKGFTLNPPTIMDSGKDTSSTSPKAVLKYARQALKSPDKELAVLYYRSKRPNTPDVRVRSEWLWSDMIENHFKLAKENYSDKRFLCLQCKLPTGAANSSLGSLNDKIATQTIQPTNCDISVARMCPARTPPSASELAAILLACQQKSKSQTNSNHPKYAETDQTSENVSANLEFMSAKEVKRHAQRHPHFAPDVPSVSDDVMDLPTSEFDVDSLFA